MKDEAVGSPITEFVGKRITMYSYIKDDNEGGVRTDKGVKKSVIKKIIRHDNYRGVLFNSRKLHLNMKGIRSVNHQPQSYQIKKVSLSCFGNNRYLLEDQIESYAYGHYSIVHVPRS